MSSSIWKVAELASRSTLAITRRSNPEVLARDRDLAAAAREQGELVHHRRAPADAGRHGGARDAELGERAEAEDEARAEHDVQEVSEHSARIASAASPRRGTPS